MTALVLTLSFAGCGETTTTSEIWEEFEEVVSGTGGTYVSGTEGTTITQDGQGGGGNTAPDKDKPSEEGGVDLKGAKISIAGWGVDLQEPQPGTPTYEDKQKLVSQIEKKYNCKLEWVHIADSLTYNSSWATAAASGTKFADLVSLSAKWAMPTQIMKGFITPLDGYLDFNDASLDKKKMDAMTYQGKHYMAFASGGGSIPSGIFYNKSLFAKLGAKTPADYVKENNWNWNTFLECAKAMTQSSGGVQYYGYALKNGNIHAWLRTNGASIVSKNADGSHTFTLDSPAAIEALQFAWDLYNTHNVTPANCGDAVNVWKKGNVAMIIGDSYEGPEYMEALGSSNVGFTHMPLGNKVSNYSQIYTASDAMGWVIPSTVKNPEAVSKILYDWIYPYTWRSTWEENNENNFGDAASFNTAKEMRDYAARNFSGFDALYSYITTTVSWGNFGIQDKIAPQAYAASVKAEAQAELDSVWAGYTP